MSYPPPLNRQQIGIPQLPPRIPPPQFGAFGPTVPPGTPMIPVHMGVVTPTPTVLVPTSIAVAQKPMLSKKDPGTIRAKDIDDSGGPTTTVFVGNISEKASDMLVRQLLAKCGIVLSWKRVQGASGKLQAFGFCEYKEPESTLRALRLLHELLLGDKKLLVKVDAKTKAQLDEWKAKKRSANGGASSGANNGDEDEEEVLHEETLRRDQVVKGAIEVLIREYASELNAPSQDGDSQPRNKKRKEKKEEDINAMEMEDDKRDLISREISKFRDTHKKLEEEKGKKEKERLEIERERRERDKERERERERRDREKEKERERERDKERERDRDRDRDRERDRERERTKERERERSRDVSEDRSRSSAALRLAAGVGSNQINKTDYTRNKERTREDKKRDREEDEEDVYERRRLERRLRDKEAAYQERLKNWEIRERKKSRDYSKETEREDERRREMMKEAKRLKEFLEDYDDDRDDPKYYRGSALQKRLRDREKETELDERDRKREKEELEEIRQRLLAEGHPDPDAELQRMEEEAERRRQPPLKLEPEEEVNQEKSHKDRDREKRGSGRPAEPMPRPPQQHSDDDDVEAEEDDYPDGEDSQEAKPQLKPIMRPITTAPSVSSASGNATPNSPGNESPCGIIIPGENTPEVQPPEEHRPKIGLSLKLGATNSPSQLNVGKRKKLATVESVFNKFDDEEADEQPRKRKLVPLDYGDDDKSLGLDGAEISGAKGSINTEEKRKHIKSLIEKIPTARPELFSYPLDWTMVDSTLMDRRIRPWINKKIIEYIGEEEPTLVDFVCSKVMAHSTPQGILDDVAMVLDEEAEVFIVKMWRLLIYETEAKKIGLVK
ncbi:RNA-binding protein 25 isoform X2 [Pagrus major]|uniref:RNA-binding protein 25 isoform X2 n=1 Tax=Pagrus major TaxID=143350 RepID=UPI003CC865E6